MEVCDAEQMKYESEPVLSSKASAGLELVVINNAVVDKHLTKVRTDHHGQKYFILALHLLHFFQVFHIACGTPEHLQHH